MNTIGKQNGSDHGTPGAPEDSVRDALETLSAVPYFTGLDKDTLQVIARSAVQCNHDRGQVVFMEGECHVGLCVVQRGWLKVVKLSPDGREQILRTVGPGQVCNDFGAFANRPCPATGTALSEISVWFLDAQVVLHQVEHVPVLARAVVEGLAERAFHLLALVEDLSLRTVEARLARILLERAEDGTLHRYRWATQTEIAARLGTVPDVISRVLRKLADEGLISVSRQQIDILDHQRLRSRAYQIE